VTRLEYGDLYRFLASLGIVLISLALLVPWLFLRESFDGLLKPSDISELTPTGQLLLAYRQQTALWVIQNLWWISSLLVIGGLVFLSAGVYLWWTRRQRVLDRREESKTRKVDLEVEQLKREMQPLKPGVIAINAIREITEELEAETPPEPAVVSSVRTGVQDYLRVEEIFFDKLVTCYGDERVLTHQRARHSAYDAILVSDSPLLADVVFEVKRLARRLSFERVRAAVAQTTALIQDYAVLRARLTATVVGIVVFVVAEHDRESARMQEFLRTAKDQADLYGVNVHPIFITEKELRDIRCSDLRAMINDIAAAVR
jgi:hypothetical protein